MTAQSARSGTARLVTSSSPEAISSRSASRSLTSDRKRNRFCRAPMPSESLAPARTRSRGPGPCPWSASLAARSAVPSPKSRASANRKQSRRPPRRPRPSGVRRSLARGDPGGVTAAWSGRQPRPPGPRRRAGQCEPPPPGALPDRRYARPGCDSVGRYPVRRSTSGRARRVDAGDAARVRVEGCEATVEDGVGHLLGVAALARLAVTVWSRWSARGPHRPSAAAITPSARSASASARASRSRWVARRSPEVIALTTTPSNRNRVTRKLGGRDHLGRREELCEQYDLGDRANGRRSRPPAGRRPKRRPRLLPT